MNIQRYFRQKQREKRQGRSYKTELENLQVILAHQADLITWEQVCEFFNLKSSDYVALATVDNIRQEAVRAGKELAK